MKRIPIRKQGLVGTLFRKGNPTTAIICLGGSSGGLHETRAEKLASHGFASLALAYFAAESLPTKLESIPLEYFERAIQRMHNEPGIEKVALWGGSRGAEVALILGTLFPRLIDAIAAHVPSSVVFGALDDPKSVAWTYRGKPIVPNAPFEYTQKTNGKCERTAISVTSCFLKSMQDKEGYESSAIPVEKLRCPLLLISAGDDQMWPSEVFANQIIERLERHDSSIHCSHLSYKDVGHAPYKGEVGLHPIMNRWFAFGGNPEENAKAAIEWTEKTIHFFKENL